MPEKNPLQVELEKLIEDMQTAEIMHGTKLMKVGDPELSGRKLDQAIRWAQGRLGVLRANL